MNGGLLVYGYGIDMVLWFKNPISKKLHGEKLREDEKNSLSDLTLISWNTQLKLHVLYVTEKLEMMMVRNIDECVFLRVPRSEKLAE